VFSLQQRQADAALRDEVARLRRQGEAMAELRADNERLRAAETARAPDEEKARAEHTELVRLRAGVEAYRKQQALAARNAATSAPVGPGTTSPSLDAGMLSVGMMKNVGRATPNAAAQTQLWATQHGDIDLAATLITFDPPERAKLEAMLATLPENLRTEYGTPERMIALVLAGTPRPLAGVQQLGESQPSQDEIVHHVQMQFQSGEVRQDDIRFRRDAEGWKQVISSSTVDKVIAHFRGK